MTTLNGSPAVCASMVIMLFQSEGGFHFVCFIMPKSFLSLIKAYRSISFPRWSLIALRRANSATAKS